MTVKIGNDNISEIYYGNDRIRCIYNGSDLVYNRRETIDWSKGTVTGVNVFGNVSPQAHQHWGGFVSDKFTFDELKVKGKWKIGIGWFRQSAVHSLNLSVKFVYEDDSEETVYNSTSTSDWYVTSGGRNTVYAIASKEIKEIILENSTSTSGKTNVYAGFVIKNMQWLGTDQD